MIVSVDLSGINFAPDSLEAEVMQNIKMILSTMFFSVPYFRDFAYQPDYLDLPIQGQRARISADVVTAIQKYEPRVIIEQILFDGEAIEGLIVPSVQVRLKND